MRYRWLGILLAILAFRGSNQVMVMYFFTFPCWKDADNGQFLNCFQLILFSVRFCASFCFVLFYVSCLFSKSPITRSSSKTRMVLAQFYLKMFFPLLRCSTETKIFLEKKVIRDFPKHRRTDGQTHKPITDLPYTGTGSVTRCWSKK